MEQTVTSTLPNPSTRYQIDITMSSGAYAVAEVIAVVDRSKIEFPSWHN
jgi:hypothetical protein